MQLVRNLRTPSPYGADCESARYGLTVRTCRTKCFNLSLCCNTTDINNGLHSLLHILNGNKLMATVEIKSTCKNIGARQPLERELGTICTTTDGDNLAEATGLFNCLLGNIGDMGLIAKL